MSESEQNLHRDVSHESDEHDQDEGGDDAEDLKSEGNRHDSSANYASGDVEHGAGDRGSPRRRLCRRQERYVFRRRRHPGGESVKNWREEGRKRRTNMSNLLLRGVWRG